MMIIKTKLAKEMLLHVIVAIIEFEGNYFNHLVITDLFYRNYI